VYPKPRNSGYDKHNPVDRWQLTDRVFFACGACHILAYAFLERYDPENAKAVWIKPAAGHTGNHVFVDMGQRVFDYHGYSDRDAFMKHLFRRSRHYWSDWDAEFVELPRDVLISERKSRTYDGLWLREPGQFLHNALPRAAAYLDKFPVPH